MMIRLLVHLWIVLLMSAAFAIIGYGLESTVYAIAKGAIAGLVVGMTYEAYYGLEAYRSKSKGVQ